MEENICESCAFLLNGWRCNRLVSSCVGMSDRLGSDYKKNNKCPYYEQGKGQTCSPHHSFAEWNS